MQKDLQALRGMVQRQSGGIVIDSSMKIVEAVSIEPRRRDILAQFRLGGRSSYGINEEHTWETPHDDLLYLIEF